VRIVALHSHLNGWEFIKVHKPHLWDEIEAIIASVDATICRTKESKEARSKGKMFYSPVAMNGAMKREFSRRDWKEQRTSYWVTEDSDLIEKTMKLPAAEQKQKIDAAGKRAISSYNQTDFVKHKIAVEVQFGKYSFVALTYLSNTWLSTSAT